ncbi:unnamed protein product [Polarella glacialis]|uniref:Uncharacterized protein n=1 Tax=Polarella glacialis TaxID=89957 RepID=A0A813FCL8_POLGL|nr:unnamed protein product [Polarella glacialis]
MCSLLPTPLTGQRITMENVVSVFRRHNVPQEPGIVMIDIDSCDLWVFLGLTEVFRPRVVQIEYNRHLRFADNLTLDCRAGGKPGTTDSELYGASIHAIAASAEARGYAVAWVERCFDVFLVRSDLVCPGSKLPNLDAFKSFTLHDGGCLDPWGEFASPATAQERQSVFLDLSSTPTSLRKGDR